MGPLTPAMGLPDPTRASDILPDQPENRYPIHIGVDVGQVNDPTATVVAEVGQRWTGKTRPVTRDTDSARVRMLDDVRSYVELVTETVYLVRAMRRLQLQTRYPDVARQIADIVCSPLLDGRRRRVFIDQTGVGRPVVELVRDAIRERAGAGGMAGISIKPITFTSGERYDRQTGRMGKAYMVSRLQALSQTDPPQMILPEGHPEAPAMWRELKDYSLKVSQDGADTYGALKIGQHDDLATALGLAVLEDPHEYELRTGPRIW